MGSTPFGMMAGWSDRRRRRGRKPGRRQGWNCDGCDACNFWLLSVLRLSTVLLVAAAVLPDAGGTALVSRTIAGYQRWLSRFTAECPSTPHCSAYAAAAVRDQGARRGLRAAAARIAACSGPVQ